MAEQDTPARVAEAIALAGRLGFAKSSTPGRRALAAYAPFGLLFLDGGGKRDGPRAVADLMAPGGIVVLDDFTVCDAWPPTYLGEPDALRVAWLTDPRFAAAEVRTGADQAALIATRR